MRPNHTSERHHAHEERDPSPYIPAPSVLLPLLARTDFVTNQVRYFEPQVAE
jgi:hypothetical protein